MTVPSIRIQDFPLWDRLAARRVPLSFDLEVTARCVNNCRHCYINLPAGDAAAQGRELGLAEIERIAAEAADLGALWCLVTGGEPLLRLDFPEIYLVLKKKGLLVSVFTSGCLITEEHVRLFRKYPPRDIEITVYGVTRETYERVTRRPGSFKAFMRGLDRLIDAGVRVRLKAMALRSNVHELPQIARFCRELTQDHFRFDPVLHARFDGDERRNAEIRAERLAPEEIAALERADGERFDAMIKSCADLIQPDAEHTDCDHLFHCGAGNGSFSVGDDGTFHLCSSLWAPGTTANLRETPLREAWETLVPRVRDLRSRDPRYLSTCRTCPIVNLCLHCPAHAHLETGAMDGETPYHCAVARARAAALAGETPLSR